MNTRSVKENPTSVVRHSSAYTTWPAAGIKEDNKKRVVHYDFFDDGPVAGTQFLSQIPLMKLVHG